MGRGHYDRSAVRLRHDVPASSVAPDPVAAAYRLTAPHGFIEDVHGKGVFHWEAGEIVSRPATIRLLLDRGAPMAPWHEST